ncbi:MAG: hypothetical protein IJ752_01480 [Alphaproteobacteria bacterium]|nr:hypothetical protein [Alphaproteobacteria bacterium]
MTNKIALTSSMRSNLLSLKNTQGLIDRTQNRLSTGYKVNSAMDNPSSYFTAQALNSRAGDLSTLLDSIGQAISTLEVADKGISTLQEFVEQAKSVANSARDTSNVSASVASTIKFDENALVSQLVAGDALPNATAGDTITIRVGDSTKLTGTTNLQSDSTLVSIGAQSASAGSIKFGGQEYLINTTAAANSMTKTYATSSVFKIVDINGTDSYTLEDVDGVRHTYEGDIASDIPAVGGHSAAVGDTVTNASAPVTVTVTENGRTTVSGSFTLTTDSGGTNYEAGTVAGSLSGPTINVKNGSTVEEFANVLTSMIGSNLFNASVVESNMVFATKDTSSLEITGAIATAFGMDIGTTITLDAADTAESLRQKIAGVDGVTAEFDKKGHMVIKSAEGDDLVISGALADKLGVSGAATNGSNERAAYASQFNDILQQVDELVQDTSYKGINLLNGDNLTVNFNESRTSKLELKGVTFNSVGLGFTQAANEWKSNESIDKSLDQITKATSMLRSQASAFGQNLSTVQIREDFTQNMINNLQSGADKLTLADMNEEAANMLALQTRQQLGINSLSLASQASQSVLQLF